MLNSRTVYIGGTYLPPKSSIHVLEKLIDHMDRNFSHKGNIILLRDFNLLGFDWLTYSPGTIKAASLDQLLELALCYNLTQIVTDYTKLLCTTTPSFLDLLCVFERLTCRTSIIWIQGQAL